MYQTCAGRARPARRCAAAGGGSGGAAEFTVRLGWIYEWILQCGINNVLPAWLCSTILTQNCCTLLSDGRISFLYTTCLPAHKWAKRQKFARNGNKIFWELAVLSYACNSLTNLEYEVHPFTGNENVESGFKKLWDHNVTNWSESISGGF